MMSESENQEPVCGSESSSESRVSKLEEEQNNEAEAKPGNSPTSSGDQSSERRSQPDLVSSSKESRGPGGGGGLVQGQPQIRNNQEIRVRDNRQDDEDEDVPHHGPPGDPPHHYVSHHHMEPPHHHHGGHSGPSHLLPPAQARTRYENKKDKFPNYLHHISPENDPLVTRTLFAGNLEVSITDEELRRIFGRYGTVEDIDIKRPPPGTGNAYAFVRFVNLDMAARAKSELSGQYIGKFQCKIVPVRKNLSVHRESINEINTLASSLISSSNHHAPQIEQRMTVLLQKMEGLANKRKHALLDNSAYLQFMRKADVVESWIADKETHVRSEEFGRDLSTVQTLLTKQDTFDAGLNAFESEGIANIRNLKDKLIESNHVQSGMINKRFEDVLKRWTDLLEASNARKSRLLHMQEQFRKQVAFAVKAKAFKSWLENAEENLTDPVRCNFAQFQASLSSAEEKFQALGALDKQIKGFNVGPDPYTWCTMEALEENWRNLQKIIKERDVDLAKELLRSIQSKQQKHQQFETQLAAKVAKSQAELANLIEKRKCAGSEEAVEARLESIAKRWETLTIKSSEKSLKLKEDIQRQTWIVAVKQLDFWLWGVEGLLTSEDSGKDLASVQNLIKEHQLVEADITEHYERISDMNSQADSLIESERFDAVAIQEKRQSINTRFERVKNLAAHRQSRLNEAFTLHQFFRDIADQESWIKEKKLLVGSGDFGRDLTGVQNLKKKHKRLEAELQSHEPAIQAVQEAGSKLMDISNIGVPDIESRLKALSQAWSELKKLCSERGEELEQRLVDQQLIAKFIETEALIEEQEQLLDDDDHVEGDISDDNMGGDQDDDDVADKSKSAPRRRRLFRASTLRSGSGGTPSASTRRARRGRTAVASGGGASAAKRGGGRGGRSKRRRGPRGSRAAAGSSTGIKLNNEKMSRGLFPRKRTRSVTNAIANASGVKRKRGSSTSSGSPVGTKISNSRTKMSRLQLVCRFCGMTFYKRWNLTAHERIHTGERPHECLFCSGSFIQRAHLIKHISSVHSYSAGVVPGKDFSCCFCGQPFKNKDAVRRHISTYHRDLFTKNIRAPSSQSNSMPSAEHSRLPAATDASSTLTSNSSGYNSGNSPANKKQRRVGRQNSAGKRPPQKAANPPGRDKTAPTASLVLHKLDLNTAAQLLHKPSGLVPPVHLLPRPPTSKEAKQQQQRPVLDPPPRRIIIIRRNATPRADSVVTASAGAIGQATDRVEGEQFHDGQRVEEQVEEAAARARELDPAAEQQAEEHAEGNRQAEGKGLRKIHLFANSNVSLTSVGFNEEMMKVGSNEGVMLGDFKGEPITADVDDDKGGSAFEDDDKHALNTTVIERKEEQREPTTVPIKVEREVVDEEQTDLLGGSGDGGDPPTLATEMTSSTEITSSPTEETVPRPSSSYYYQ